VIERIQVLSERVREVHVPVVGLAREMIDAPHQTARRAPLPDVIHGLRRLSAVRTTTRPCDDGGRFRQSIDWASRSIAMLVG
jgi:hypothetical protein